MFLVASTRTMEDFLRFLEVVKREARKDRSDSRNYDLVQFLDAMQAWLRDYTASHDRKLANGRSVDDFDWNVAAQLIISGWEYE
jgi:hypothetical protein